MLKLSFILFSISCLNASLNEQAKYPTEAIQKLVAKKFMGKQMNGNVVQTYVNEQYVWNLSELARLINEMSNKPRYRRKSI